jgi:hypothetical protein
VWWGDRAAWGKFVVRAGKSSKGTHNILPRDAEVAAWAPIERPARSPHPG